MSNRLKGRNRSIIIKISSNYYFRMRLPNKYWKCDAFGAVVANQDYFRRVLLFVEYENSIRVVTNKNEPSRHL